MTTYKGTHITKFDSKPQERVDARLHGGLLKRWKDAFEIPDTANDDVVILFKLPIDLVVDFVRLAADDLSSGAFDLGLYKKNNDGTYTVVSVDCFADGVTFGSGAIARTDYTYNDAATDISKAIQPLWQRAGLSARPAYGELYLGLATPTGTGATGTVLAEVVGTE